MKKVLLLGITFLTALTIYSSAFAQFSENMGTGGGNGTSFASYAGWQNNGSFIYSGTGDVRTTSSSSLYAGASGNTNVFLTGSAGTTFQVASINSNSLTNPAISFGLAKTTNSGDATDLKFEYSINGSIFSTISIPAQPTGTGTTGWRLITLTGLPKTTTLTIKFTNLGTSSTGYRVDDISINSLTVLPISLSSFTAKAVDKAILLNWKTASEKNNQKFEVLRSGDDKNFKAIGTVGGAGNSDSEETYAFADENPYAGTNYYQLQQTDNDGTSTVSDVVSAVSKVDAVKITVFASNNSVSVNINSPSQTEAEITLFDLSGKSLSSKSLILNKGYNEVVFNNALTPGVYFVNLVIAGKSTSLKFIK